MSLRRAKKTISHEMAQIIFELSEGRNIHKSEKEQGKILHSGKKGSCESLSSRNKLLLTNRKINNAEHKLTVNNHIECEPRHEKPVFGALRPGKTQHGLLDYRG